VPDVHTTATGEAVARAMLDVMQETTLERSAGRTPGGDASWCWGPSGSRMRH
jgi:hypothetical protein